MPDASPVTTVRIRALMPSLAPAERRVAACVLADPAAVAASTIGLIAQRCATSETTVLRFCRAVGYAGYDTVRYVEHLPDAPEDDRGLPDLSFACYDRMVVFDHIEKTIAAVAHADDEVLADGVAHGAQHLVRQPHPVR